LGEFLGELVEESQKGRDTKLFDPELPDALRKAIVQAWEEIRKREVIEKAANIQADVPRQVLEDCGLTGSQLSLKMQAIRWICVRFSPSPIGGLLRRVLTAIDNLLGSLAHGNVIAESLKEFKEVLEALAHDH